MKRELWILFALFLVLPTPVRGQNREELIQVLMARIDKLERRVAELERNQRGPTKVAVVEAAALGEVASHPPTEQAVPAASPQAQVGAETHPEHPSLTIAGFSDFNFAATDQRGTRSGFNEGQFTFHMTSALSPKVNFFGEMTFTARADAGTGTPAATGFNAEVERTIIRFDQSDRFKMSFGRYHTPVNWWNTAFHHGQWLQTTISRPEMTMFGGRFIPVHFVGGLIEGSLPSGGLNLNYNVGLGNGRGTVISRGGDAGDNNNNRAWMVNLFLRPDRPYGLQAGGSVYRDKISLATGRQFREWITSGHLVWQKETPEFIAEVANVNHQEVGRTHSSNSQAFYVQAGYRFNLWKPYYRFEYIHIPRTDPVFQGVPNLKGSTVGLRYDLTSFAAIKFEYRNQRRPGQPRVNGAFIQTSFAF